MNVLVVTNNPEAGERLEKLGLCVEFTDGNAKRSLLHARDLIIKGWHLAADPRGGYNKRYNPCHTVFLCDEAISNMGEDVYKRQVSVSGTPVRSVKMSIGAVTRITVLVWTNIWSSAVKSAVNL